MYFGPTCPKLEVPTTSFSSSPEGLLPLLEWLTELRKVVYLLHYRFLIKDATQASQVEEMQRAVGAGGSFRAHSGCAALPAPPCMDQSGISLNSVFQEIYEAFIAWYRLIKSLAIDD